MAVSGRHFGDRSVLLVTRWHWHSGVHWCFLHFGLGTSTAPPTRGREKLDSGKHSQACATLKWMYSSACHQRAAETLHALLCTTVKWLQGAEELARQL
eukprot:781499-Amphidinium_carterae.1